MRPQQLTSLALQLLKNIADIVENMEYPRASLLGLPTELRIQIYNYILPGISIKLSDRLPYRTHTISNRDVRSACAWLQICRLIRHELHNDFYSTVTFEVQEGFPSHKLGSWLKAIGPEAVEKLRYVIMFGKAKCSMWKLQPG